MKIIRLFLLLLTCSALQNVFAQSPKAIEADLLSAFKKIDYQSQDNEAANGLFAQKLKQFAEKYPATLAQSFDRLKAEHLDISSSTDGQFRIYSWDTWTGGTMHFFESVFQYRLGSKTIALLDTPQTEGDSRPNYYKLFTFKANNITYYLPVYRTVSSGNDVGDGINVFAIENDKLNTAVKLIKTKTGLHSSLSYSYDFSSVADIAFEKRPTITFDQASKTIRIPLVDAKGRVTGKTIAYKFSGKYFEKVNS